MMRINRILAAVIVSLVLWVAVLPRVERYSVAALSDNRVVYALPLTHLYLQVELEKVIEQPGGYRSMPSASSVVGMLS